jgi:GntR family transcriptional regulator, transcriptional repressor for pyruvate dehydrogenase complex
LCVTLGFVSADSPTDNQPRPVRAPKTAEIIADQLRGDIVRGVLKTGDTLPTEVILGKQFGVSRPTLREAIRILENESLIVARRGSRGGVVVATPDIAVAAKDFGLLLQMSGTTLADVYRARMVIEPPAARMLAERHTAQDVEDLDACVGRLAVLVNEGAQTADFREWSNVAYRFHDLIMERSGNKTLAIFGGVLREVVARHISRAVTASDDRAGIEGQFKKTVRAFAKLVRLVEAGDADGAEKFWRTHMQVASKGMLWGSLATESVVDLFV